MALDFAAFFDRYEQLVAEVDAVFARVKAATGECVTCTEGCSDCCHALFDLTLIEALYLNHRFNQAHDSGKTRDDILVRANKADRAVYKIKKQAHEAIQAGRSVDDVLAEVAAQRVRCALLGDADTCDLYAHRPITCRLYGIPTAIGGKGRTCGLSGFEQGTPYPTVHLEKIQDRLLKLSKDLAQAIGSKHAFLPEVLVPVSMALLTEYDEEYLGTPKPEVQFEREGKTMSWSIGDAKGRRQAGPALQPLEVKGGCACGSAKPSGPDLPGAAGGCACGSTCGSKGDADGQGGCACS
jgi:Fe-S-cluster containining protein